MPGRDWRGAPWCARLAALVVVRARAARRQRTAWQSTAQTARAEKNMMGPLDGASHGAIPSDAPAFYCPTIHRPERHGGSALQHS